ncbi:glycosyltransferase family 4 protein [Crocosphaera sp. XPORK-15E]|uniref:glycosyltransferase family 4 protein n=1 Tax=Crocosphaera sp. XPORK-15E TaxID=3110247 RepID=UPI002B1FB885|nr:glycosyltransferase family 4 protein [Crocosphaera sp. XPORK-15E]MEA5537156.1 glycosyltransferase family 4 protein [Crocosphaera sp. XPORK-15E]
MKILMICATFPYPPSRGGTQGRTFNLLKFISQIHDTTLITQLTEDVTKEEIEQLRTYVTDLKVFPCPTGDTNGFLDKVMRFSQFFLEGTPPNVRYLYLEEIQQWIDQAVAEQRFDVITCEHSVNEIYIRPQWKHKIKTVIDIHSSVYKTCLNQLATGTSENQLRDRLYLPLLRRYEQRTLSKFSQVVVTTDEDEKQMRDFAPNAKIALIANGVDLKTFPYRSHDPGGHQLIFVGGLDYFVNIDGAVFFSQEVLPLLQTKYPNTTLTLVGSKPSPEVQALAKLPGITVTGRVPSVVDYLHRATVAVIPLRTGFGMKFKTLEAMAAGVPVVASDRGLEGMEVAGKNVPLRALRANTIEEYINRISDLFEDGNLRDTLSKNGREYIENNYTWEALGNEYEKIIAA